MLRLIGLGLLRQGISVADLHAEHRATVAIAEKRNVLDQIMSRHGPISILRLGEGVADAQDEPALIALTAAAVPLDLLARWQRLEAYVHSKHRISFEPSGEHRAVVVHHSLDAVYPPGLSESLLVFGVLTALIETVLTTHVEVQLVEPRQILRQRGIWEGSIPASIRAGVEFAWSPREARSPMPPIGNGRAKDAVRELVSADPARSWTLPVVAAELCLAVRTLQRRLHEEGCSFAGVVLDARAAHASRLLTHSREPVASIGFVSGYADQSHFTRDFKRRTAMTPALFRTSFAVVRDPANLALETGDAHAS